MVRPATSTPVDFEQVHLPVGELSAPAEQELQSGRERRRLDWGLAAGFAVSAGAVWLSGGAAGMGLDLFLQPTAMLMVFGGTLGATMVTTPGHEFKRALLRLREIVRRSTADRRALVDEAVGYARTARAKGLLQLEPAVDGVENALLREGLLLSLDGLSREDVAASLDLRLRLIERQGETDARVFESAGGFAPTIGVMGTVLGLLDVMRHFTDLGAVAGGVGTAFVSTLYGLGLANLILLPLANRIRAHSAERYEGGEMAIEAALCVRDGLPPRLVRERLNNYVR